VLPSMQKLKDQWLGTKVATPLLRHQSVSLLSFPLLAGLLQADDTHMVGPCPLLAHAWKGHFEATLGTCMVGPF
jgi:hypothetical protein